MSFFSRIAAVALAGLVLVGTSGCDSADDTSAASTGPVVQFGTTTSLATEGSTVSIPVSLTGANGTPVTVEVLFAQGSSSATFGDDFDGFGEADGATRRAVVSFSGTADETQTVTFSALEDAAVESAETAVFALQRVTGATIGTAREFRVNIGVPPISSARARAVNDVVTVEGVVTRIYGRYLFLQDDTAGIVIFSPANTTPFGAAVAAGNVQVGDRLQLTGPLSEFQATTGQPGTGLLQISTTTTPPAGVTPVGENFRVLASDQTPPPVQTITIAQFREPGDTYESEIVRIVNLRFTTTDLVFTNAFTYTVTDGTANGDLRVQGTSDTQISSSTLIPTGPFTYEGPVGQFRGTNQLQPTVLSDIGL